MTPVARIGLFPYLNVQPLVFGLRTQPGLEIVVDLPSRIAERFRAGELDAAMVPSLEAADLDASVLDSVCIASEGPVETVLLHHRVGLESVRTLALDEASRTSAALAKILIADASGRLPECSEIRADEAGTIEADAVLLIGDPAASFSRPGFAALDLGEVWQRSRSLPFVFAVIVLGPRAIDLKIGKTVLEALERGLDHAPTIARSYNSGMDPHRAERYLRQVIRYRFGDQEKKGLALFYRLAMARGLMVKAKELQFHAA